MKEFFQKNSIVIVAILCSFATIGALVVSKLDRERVSTIAAINHIKTVKSVDRNCNDCHLGGSFVNLFNHPAVKGDDNTIRLMMDKAHIKQW